MPAALNALIDECLTRIGLNKADAAHRARALAIANDAERHIAQPGSFLYLSKVYPLLVSNNASSTPMPTAPAIDYGKKMSLRIVGEPGYLSYKPHDRFMTGAVSKFYAIRNDRPSVWTYVRDAGQVMTIYLDPRNTTGGNLSLELIAQMAVAPLLDSAASFSLLPEGYEYTLLLKRMEGQLRQQLSRPGAKAILEEFDDLLQIFYAGQRTSKEWSKTDTEAAQRKRADVELDPEA